MTQKQKYKLGEKIPIIIARTEPNFDRAVEKAYNLALLMFKSDGHGDLLEVEGFERSSCSLKMKFDSLTYEGSMSGQILEYKFEAWTEGCENDNN